jgi:hypothetical protein
LRKHKIQIDSTESFIYVFLFIGFWLLGKSKDVQRFFGGSDNYWICFLILMFLAMLFLANSAKRRGVELRGIMVKYIVPRKKIQRLQNRKNKR